MRLLVALMWLLQPVRHGLCIRLLQVWTVTQIVQHGLPVLQMRKPRLREIQPLSKVIANRKPEGWTPRLPPAQAQAPVSPEVFFPFPTHSLPNWVSPDPVRDQGLMSAESLPCEEGPGLSPGCVTTSTHRCILLAVTESCLPSGEAGCCD